MNKAPEFNPDTLSPITLVIFGITGDLSKRKLLPALYYLCLQGMLPKQFVVVGISRREVAVTDFASAIRQAVEAQGDECDEAVLARLLESIEMVQMDMSRREDYDTLHARIDELERSTKVCMERLFYLAIPSDAFTQVAENLGASGLRSGCTHEPQTHNKLLVEKPFGRDAASARTLVRQLNEHFSEDQIYRIDHYLAKETAQNILNFRFQNPLFSAVWNAKHIKALLITATESIDIEGRTDFYEQTGAMRDLIQSHLLQLLALVTMETPEKLDGAEVHRQKLALLRSIAPITADQVATRAVRGQYEGYTSEVGNPDSHTETFAALSLSIDNDRWRDVPVLLRTGKALAEKVVEITLVFSDDEKLTHDNTLTIRIQPNEGIVLSLVAKKPGVTSEVEPVQMEFCYNRSFNGGRQPDAYERVLVDAFRGDTTLFATSDEVIASWNVIDAVIDAWGSGNRDMHIYGKGTWGPLAADELASKAGCSWLTAALSICAVRPPGT